MAVWWAAAVNQLPFQIVFFWAMAVAHLLPARPTAATPPRHARVDGGRPGLLREDGPDPRRDRHRLGRLLLLGLAARPDAHDVDPLPRRDPGDDRGGRGVPRRLRSPRPQLQRRGLRQRPARRGRHQHGGRRLRRPALVGGPLRLGLPGPGRPAARRRAGDAGQPGRDRASCSARSTARAGAACAPGGCRPSSSAATSCWCSPAGRPWSATRSPSSTATRASSARSPRSRSPARRCRSSVRSSPSRPAVPASCWTTRVASAAVVAIVSVLGLVSSTQFAWHWSTHAEGRDYYAKLLPVVRDPVFPVPMVDTGVPNFVMWGLGYPANLLSHVLKPYSRQHRLPDLGGRPPDGRRRGRPGRARSSYPRPVAASPGPRPAAATPCPRAR